MQSPTLIVTNPIAPAAYSPLAILAIAQREGEDAKITGMTRSLSRRLLALNLNDAVARADRKPLGTASLSVQQMSKRIA